MPDKELPAEIAALKSGLGPFFGRLLAALERIVAVLEAIQAATVKGRKTDA